MRVILEGKEVAEVMYNPEDRLFRLEWNGHVVISPSFQEAMKKVREVVALEKGKDKMWEGKIRAGGHYVNDY